MRYALCAILLGFGLIAGVAIAQQETPVPLTPQTETDLGSSVDDLLQATPQISSQAGEAEDQAVLETEVTEAIEAPKAVEISYDPFPNATLRALDKITGRSTDIQVKTDTPIVFGSLNIEMKACYQTPPELPPEAAAFLSIKSTQAVQVETMDDAVDAGDVSTVSEDNPRLFSGWMFASSPGLSALEHPVYDVWVIRCNAA